MAVEIKKSELLALIEGGKKRKEVAQFYGISMASLKRLMKGANLTKLRAPNKGFTFIDDVPEAPVAPAPAAQ